MTAGLDLSLGGQFTTDLLLGVERLPPDHRRAYEHYFLEVIRQRGFPLHTASLWNALHFGWSLERRCYLGRGFRLVPADSDEPQPVGSFVEVKISGGRVAWGEVVYKEGRDPERITDLGEVAPAASGARLGLVRAHREAAVHEALVLDFKAFGDGLSDADRDDFARALRKGRLTSDFHKEVDVHYPAVDAGEDDLTLFARYSLREYGGSLFDEFLRDQGAGVGADDRWQLLLGSLQAVHEMATKAPDIRTFGAYHLDAEAYRARLRTSGDDPFGADAVKDVVDAIVEPPPPRPGRFAGWSGGPAQAGYRSTAGLVREYLNRHAGDDTAMSAAEQELLTGPAYARLVLEVNLAVTDRIGPDGLIRGSNVHVRLDDEWQGGGVWRSVRFADTPPPESRFGPLVALGLGYAESSDNTSPTNAGPEHQEDLVADRSDRWWRIPLRLIDLHHRDLPVDRAAIEMLPPDVTELLVDFNDGKPGPRRRRPLDRERRLVREMPYPITLVPGVIVAYNVGFGGQVLSAKVTPLAVPVEIEGRTVRFEFNETVLRREVGLMPIDPKTMPRSRSVVDQINEVFRQRGRPTEDGGRALRSEEVIAALFGPDASPAVKLPILLRLQTGDFEYRSPEWVWHAALSRRTSPREHVRVRAAREQNAGRIARILAPRMIPMRIRRFSTAGGRHPSRDKVLSYSMARARYKAEHRLPETLAPNETWVRPFPLG
ncbi:MAG: hypothetical protein ACYC65_04015 [Candidatus Limnocylindrales bacterium]